MINKKSRKVFIIVLTVLILCTIYEILLFIFGVPAGYNSAEIKCHIDSYRIIADAVYKDFYQYKTDSLWYIPSNDGKLNCRSPNNEHILDLDKEAVDAIRDILKSYYLDKQPLEFITVRKGFVIFSNINDRAQFIYSVNGNVPKGMYGKLIPFKQCRIKNIEENLYFVAELSLKLW